MAPSSRLKREESTISSMIQIYCKKQHSQPKDSLCQECQELLNYARLKLENCPHEEEKPTCLNCEIHCYQPEMRKKIRTVMRFSGPRMLLRHPLLTLRHILDGGQGGRKQGDSKKK